MVQVDVFWSYGLGAGFALAAARQLRASAAAEAGQPPAAPRAGSGVLGDRYFALTLLYVGALFGPSGAWLLWGFPSWETMHAADRWLPAWIVAAFVGTNALQAAIGFAVTRYLILRDRTRVAYLQFVGAYFGMFFILVHGWDGTGYRRFFSPTREAFERWPVGEPLGAVRAWLGSDVAITLYGMGLVLVPVMLAMMGRWHAAGSRAAGAEAGRPGVTFVAFTVWSICVLALGAAIAASVLVHAVGWVLGGLGFAVAVGAVVLVSRGPAARITARLAG